MRISLYIFINIHSILDVFCCSMHYNNNCKKTYNKPKNIWEGRTYSFNIEFYKEGGQHFQGIGGVVSRSCNLPPPPNTI